MIEQLFQIIESAATSTHAAVIISLALNIALAWGWWRREQSHAMRGDVLRAEWIQRETMFLECLTQKDEEVAGISREAFSVLQDVASAMSAMEGTLDSVETLVHLALNNRLHGIEDENVEG